MIKQNLFDNRNVQIISYIILELEITLLIFYILYLKNSRLKFKLNFNEYFYYVMNK